MKASNQKSGIERQLCRHPIKKLVLKDNCGGIQIKESTPSTPNLLHFATAMQSTPQHPPPRTPLPPSSPAQMSMVYVIQLFSLPLQDVAINPHLM